MGETWFATRSRMIHLGYPSDYLPRHLDQGYLSGLPVASAPLARIRDGFMLLLSGRKREVPHLRRALMKGRVSATDSNTSLTSILGYQAREDWDDGPRDEAILEIDHDIRWSVGDEPSPDEAAAAYLEAANRRERRRLSPSVEMVRHAAAELEYGDTPTTSVVAALFVALIDEWSGQPPPAHSRANEREDKPKQLSLPFD